jgi:hypothetical protein
MYWIPTPQPAPLYGMGTFADEHPDLLKYAGLGLIAYLVIGMLQARPKRFGR